MKYALVFVFDFMFLCTVAIVWWRYVPLTDGVYTVGNDRIAWHMAVSNGVLGTTAIENRATGARLVVSGSDFILRMGTAKSIGWMKECQKPTDQWPPLMVRDGRIVTPARCRPVMLVRGLTTWRIILVEPSLNCTIQLEFEAKRGEPWMRRRILLTPRNPRAELAIDGALQVRWRTKAVPVHGGMGQPLYLDTAWFTALEHPWAVNMCSNGVVTLQQFPGFQFGREGARLKSMVVGASPTGEIRAVVDQYVDTIRRPPRSLSLYNTWCDLRGTELTQAAIETSAREIARGLGRYGTRLDVIAVDDGWQIRKSLWECDRTKMAEGLAGVRKRVEALGMQLGIWFPLSGLNLDIAWGERKGYESGSPKYYCMSGSNYNHALRQKLRATMTQGNIRYFKHDFNFFWCGKTKHGHFVSRAQSTEANIDAEFSLLEMESRVQPGIFLALTTGTWPSPWWLPAADAIWMGGADHDYDRTQPCSRESVYELNYRDGALYNLLVEQGLVFPLQAIMTHGVVDARHTYYDVSREDDEGWANYVMNYLGRGTMMREFYLTPSLVTQKRWKILARGLEWATSLDPCMARAHFVLGDPRKGELFGYVGTDGTMQYTSLRNPGLASASVAWKTLGFSNDMCEIVYPWHEWVNTRAVPAIDVPGEAVMQAMDCPAGVARPVPLGVRAEMTSNTSDLTVYSVRMPQHVAQFDIVSPVKLRNVEVEDGSVVISKDGRSARMTMQEEVRAVRFDVTDAAFDTHGVFHCRALLGGPVQGRLRIVVRHTSPVMPVASINSKSARVESVNGAGWQIITVQCNPGTNDVYIGLRGAGTAPAPLSLQAFAAQETTTRQSVLRIRHDRVGKLPRAVRPVPVLQDSVRECRALTAPVQASFDALSAEVKRVHSLTEADLRNVRYAWLKFDVFDVNGGRYVKKRVMVNGMFIGMLATNQNPVATWHAAGMELTEKAVRTLTRDNVVSVEDRTGDMYKVRRWSLVVELSDGRQVTTEPDPSVFSSNMKWPYKEGNQLPLDGSPAARLLF